LIEAIRALPPDRGGLVLSIVSSGSLREDALERVRALGFQATLHKPFDAATLLETVERVLRLA
jgi:CheY-like chemotaxis protein